jgi:sulfoxide reductase heme-binding subunit YedZ
MLSLVLLVGISTLLHHEGFVARMTVASAYTGLVLLGVTLLLGPIQVLRRRPNPISTDLRRDVGIWAGLISLLHVVLGFQTHFPGQPWFFLLDETSFLPRIDRFGVANILGLGATLIIALLLAISNDWSLRRLGTSRWKAIQRLNYALLALVAAHAIVYLPYEGRGRRFLITCVAILFVVTIGQVAGYWQRRQAPARSIAAVEPSALSARRMGDGG